MQRIQMLGRGQRVLLFVMIFGGGLMLIAGLTIFLILQAINSSPREQSRPIQEEPITLPFSAEGDRTFTVTVEELARLEDDDAFPGSVAVSTDGRVFTGSFSTGAIYSIPAQGNVEVEAAIIEIDGTRERIGAVTGMEAGPDGSIYILDRADSNPRAAGGTVWRLDAESTLIDLGEPRGVEGFIAPGHITLDAAGNLYVTDRGTREIWRYDGESGETSRLWLVPEDLQNAGEIIPTGIAYDATTDSLIVTDSEVNVILRVSLDGQTTEELYRYEGSSDDAPSFDGVDVDGDGRVYVAALGTRRVMVLLDGELYTLAENFRQVTDVDVLGNTIYATNLDGRSLVLPGVNPQLPFSVDIITLEDSP